MTPKKSQRPEGTKHNNNNRERRRKRLIKEEEKVSVAGGRCRAGKRDVESTRPVVPKFYIREGHTLLLSSRPIPLWRESGKIRHNIRKIPLLKDSFEMTKN